MKNILILGAGRIGQAIAALLATRPERYNVTLADADERALASVRSPGVDRLLLRADDTEACRHHFADYYAVISALPYSATMQIARIAKETSTHYLDLTEDVATTKAIRTLAQDATSALIPQCGLAPGFISILGYDMVQRFESLDSLRLRVGALPQYPANSLSYNLTWSTEGVINEYCQPCEALVGGERKLVAALEDVERFVIDGQAFESFNTSGGLGTLCETLEGQVKHLHYQTIRYPGHRDIMKTLIHDLRLGERQELFKEVLEYAIPSTSQDVIVIFVSATGRIGGRLMQESYANRIYPRTLDGTKWTAIQMTTASSVCAVLELLEDGKIPQRGFVRQERIPLRDFLSSSFGEVFRKEETEAEVVSA